MPIRSLATPLEIDGDPHATEMMRVWLAHDDVHLTLLLGMWADADDSDVEEGEAWGNLLADVALHVAHGMAHSHAWDRKDTLTKIRRAFLENLDYQERKLSGKYVD
jgi:hypothetical protein